AKEQHAAYERRLAERSRLEAERGRPLRGRKPKPPAEAPAHSARVNTTDPDSSLQRTRDGFVQGYNAQAVVAEGQLIVAAELSSDSPDGRLLEPMVEAARAELAAVGLEEAPAVVVADARGRRRRRVAAADRALLGLPRPADHRAAAHGRNGGPAAWLRRPRRAPGGVAAG